jgi:Leucine-rich repeat (LRR) protein
MSSLANLTSLTSLRLDSNQIGDISPLVANVELGEEDQINLDDNPLSYASLHTCIPQLQAQGVSVSY